MTTATAKTFYAMDSIGNAKYTVNAHDGQQTHPDGSPFYGIRIFRNKRSRDKYVKELRTQGYTERH